MLYSEIIAVCSQIHTKHVNTLCGQNVELWNGKLAVHIVTSETVNNTSRSSLSSLCHTLQSTRVLPMTIVTCFPVHVAIIH
jgi:hypothetical protein